MFAAKFAVAWAVVLLPLITAAASSSRTASAPASASTAMTSTPTRPCRNASAIAHSAYAVPPAPAAAHSTFPAPPVPARCRARPASRPEAVSVSITTAKQQASHPPARPRRPVMLMIIPATGGPAQRPSPSPGQALCPH